MCRSSSWKWIGQDRGDGGDEGELEERYRLIMSLLAVLLAGCGAWTDLNDHKIYNRLTLPSVLIGMTLNLLFGGITGLKDSVLGFLLGSTFMLFGILGMLKAGDVKLYMAVGALAGARFCGYTMICSVLIGGVAAACVMATRKTGKASLIRIKQYLLALFYTRQFRPYRPAEQSAYFSFGCCIFAGALGAFWLLYHR